MPQPTLSPDRIMQLGFGFWGSKTLLSAVELGLFTLLAKRPLDGEAIRKQLELHPRAARDFLDALVALKMLERDGNGPAATYRNTPDAEAFLAASRSALAAARTRGWTIAHIHIGFAEDYSDLPVSGTLFNKVRDFGAVKRDVQVDPAKMRPPPPPKG